jgi:antitoxin component YwqK of YwqJK toxin-antitoxin module
MNKRIFLAVLPVILLVSCSREKTITESTFPDGSPKRVCTYIIHGRAKDIINETTYYPGKKLQMTGTYKENKRDGRWIYYYQNGNVWSEGFFKGGKNDGKRVTYFESGKVRYEANYREGQRVGKWRFFDEKGNLLQTIDYDLPLDSIKQL